VDWRAKVDLFEQLRREHEFGIGTIAGAAAKFGVHRRVVRQAIASALPAKHHYPPRTKPKLGMDQEMRLSLDISDEFRS
jgi:predicted secreted protein